MISLSLESAYVPVTDYKDLSSSLKVYGQTQLGQVLLGTSN